METIRCQVLSSLGMNWLIRKRACSLEDLSWTWRCVDLFLLHAGCKPKYPSRAFLSDHLPLVYTVSGQMIPSKRRFCFCTGIGRKKGSMKIIPHFFYFCIHREKATSIRWWNGLLINNYHCRIVLMVSIINHNGLIMPMIIKSLFIMPSQQKLRN